ncbi:MAG: sulfotransferase, partial [Anaerolineae bacterium]
MAFNFKGLARFTCRQLFRSRGTPYRLSPKRIVLLLLFYTAFTLLELMTWLGFLLDDVFFREYREREIRQAVFIVGNPRSGTTFLYRLMAKDEENFTCTQMWEVLVAPSITQRRVVEALGALDRRLGRPLDRLATAWSKRWREENVVHRVALRAPEEDQYLLVHIWSTLAVWSFSAILEEAGPYTYFDTEMSPAEKKRIMVFYERCIQRHLHARGGDRERAKHYLSKNPSASPKVDALYEFFPDAKIIYLARSPLDMIPSYISLLDFAWNILGDPVEACG